jgi:hypothetical protein
VNTLVAEYRKRVPNDPRSDDDLTLLLGQSNQDGRFNGYQDFVQDYSRLTAPEPVEPPPVGQEFRRGVSSGVNSLKSSAYGIGALGADVVGADSVKNALIQKYKDTEEQSAAEGPTVSKVEDIHSPSDVARYVAGKAGEMVPNVGEALLTGAAGALAGTAAEPVGGTVAGGIGGFIGRSAAKSALKAILEKGEDIVADKAVRGVVREQLEKLVAKEAVSDIAPATKQLLETEIKATARKYGANAAEVLNFAGLGAGSEFPHLVSTEGVTPQDARVGALIAGIGGGAGALLPATVIGKLFPGVGEEVATTYTKRLATEAAQHIPAAVVGMGAMELGNIAAERYADPKRRDQPLSEEELSRLMNAAVVGGMMGAVTAPIAAVPGGKFDKSVERHFENVPEDRRTQIAQLKGRMTEAEQAGLTPHAEDISAFRSLNPEESNFYTVTEPQKTPSSREVVNPATAAESQAGGSSSDIKTPGSETTSEAGGDSTTPPAPTGGVSQLVLNPKDGTFGFSNPEDLTKLQAKLADLRKAASVTVSETDPLIEAARTKARAQTNPTPSTAQKLSGNYEKGKLNIDGLNIAIENPKGSERTGIGPDGKSWSVKMDQGDYGYFLGTKGKDKDHVDVTIGPNPKVDTVYVVDQIDPKTGKHDEAKVMLGYESQVQAEAAYDASFSDGLGPQRRGAVTAMSKDQLKDWLKNGDMQKPLKYVKAEAPAVETKPIVTEIAAKPEAKPAVAETVTPPARVLKPEDVDVERRATYQESGRGRKGEKEVLEPAWFRPEGNESMLKLSERLISDSSPPTGDSRNTETYRVTALQDKETGKVHLVSTFENNDETRVTKFGDRKTLLDGKADKSNVKSWPLTTVLRTKSADGSNRYEVIGSARLNKTVENLHDEFPDRATFEKEFAGKVEADQSAVRAGASAVEEKVQQGANVHGQKAEAQMSDEELLAALENDEPSEGPAFEHEPEPLNLKPEEVKVLSEQMPKVETFDDLVDVLTRKQHGEPVISDELFKIIKKVSESDPQFFLDMENIGLPKTLKRYGYEIDTGTSGQVERSAPRPERSSVPNPEPGVQAGGGPAPAAVESEQDRARQTQPVESQQSPASGEAGNPESGDAGAGLKFSETSLASERETASMAEEPLLRSIHDAATRAGIDVQARNFRMDQGLLEKTNASGAYDPKTRTLYQVLGDTIGAQDVKTALHEVGHDVFASESPEVRERLLRSIDRLSDEALGVDLSADTRIRASDPCQFGT